MIPGIQSGNSLRGYLRHLVRVLGQRALGNPFLKRIARGFLARRPALKTRLRRILQGYRGGPAKLAADKREQARRQASAGDGDAPTGSERNQSAAVNGPQKTPLESYFY